MKDLNKEIICRMEELKATPKRYLAVLAAFHVAAGLILSGMLQTDTLAVISNGLFEQSRQRK